MTTAHPSHTEFAAAARSGPAWLLSLVLHALLLVVLAVALRPSLTSLVAEPPREVGIVLSHRAATEEYRYTPETPPEEAAERQRAPGGQRTEPRQAGGEPSAALPLPPMLRLALPPIALPGEGCRCPAAKACWSTTPPCRAAAAGPWCRAWTTTRFWRKKPRGAAQRALGPTTEVSVFGSAPAVGRSFVFAIDRSKSTGGEGLNALAAAKVEFARAVSRLLPSHKFQIIAYHDQCVYYNTTRLIPATGRTRPGFPGSSTNWRHLPGTVMKRLCGRRWAWNPTPSSSLTDGGDPPLEDIQLANIRKLAAAALRSTPSSSAGGRRRTEENFLRRLAQQNGGSHTYVDMSGRGSNAG